MLHYFLQCTLYWSLLSVYDGSHVYMLTISIAAFEDKFRRIFIDCYYQFRHQHDFSLFLYGHISYNLNFSRLLSHWFHWSYMSINPLGHLITGLNTVHNLHILWWVEILDCEYKVKSCWSLFFLLNHDVLTCLFWCSL